MFVTLISVVIFAHQYFQPSIFAFPSQTPRENMLLYQTLPQISDPENTPTFFESHITSGHKPQPTITPSVLPSSQNLFELFTLYANLYNVDKNALIKIAQCESRFNPHAGTKLYLGLFQFSENTWKAWRLRMSIDPNPSLRTNAEESIKTAAYMIAQGQIGAWPTCSK